MNEKTKLLLLYINVSVEFIPYQRTDASTNGRGFQANYVTACGGRTVVGNEIGVIRSPNFPQNYNPNTNCTWILMGSQAGECR